MHRRLFFATALLVSFGSARAQKQTSPESFPHQIRQNVLALDGFTQVIHSGGAYRKVEVLEVSARLIDVVRSNSILHPYAGQLHLVTVIANGQPLDNRDKAAESKILRKDWNTSSHELMIFFSPSKSAWKMSRLQMRVNGKFEDLAPSEFSDFPDYLLNDLVEILESPVSATPVKPASKHP